MALAKKITAQTKTELAKSITDQEKQLNDIGTEIRTKQKQRSDIFNCLKTCKAVYAEKYS